MELMSIPVFILLQINLLIYQANISSSTCFLQYVTLHTQDWYKVKWMSPLQFNDPSSSVEPRPQGYDTRSRFPLRGQGSEG